MLTTIPLILLLLLYSADGCCLLVLVLLCTSKLHSAVALALRYHRLQQQQSFNPA